MQGSIDTSVINIEGNTTKLVSQINNANAAMKGFDATLIQILDHLTTLEKGIGQTGNTIGKQINNKIKKQKNVYDMGDAPYTAATSNGAMSSQTGREKKFKEYEQAIIDATNAEREYTEELRKDTQRRKQLRKQRADAETQRAANEAARIAKKEDQSTTAYQARMDKLADAKLLNAQNKVGAKDRSWRYQSAKALASMGDTVSQLGLGGKIIGGTMDSIAALLKAPAAGVMSIFANLSKGLVDLGKSAVQAFSEIESIKTQLGVVFSNQTQADAVFGEISQYAVKSPFGVQQTSELAVLLKQSGVYASDLMDTLKMLGDTAGGNMEKMKRIANNYAQIVSIGKASMLDMRQFAYAGIPIFEAVSKELNVSQQELRKMISDGKVTSDIIEKVFKDLTGINGIFNEATSKGAKTLKARLQNLKDAQQLAFGSIGEWMTSTGSQTGNDSYANRMVSFAENIYQWLREKVNTKNIENSVKVIEKRNDRIKQLQDLIEYNKDNKEAVKYLQEALARELAKRDIEKERATYEASYEDKMANYEELFQRYGILNIDTAKQRYWAMKDWQSSTGSDRNMLLNGGNADRYKEFSMLDDDSLNIAISELKEYIDLLKNLKKVTEEEIKAHRETLTLDAQQLAFDQASKNAEATGSLASRFQELASIYKESEEYKEKEEEKRIKSLEEAKDILNKIAKNTDKEGQVDISKYNKDIKELYSLLQGGALTPGRELQVVEGKTSTQKAADRKLLTSQLDIVVDAVKQSFRGVRDASGALQVFNDYKALKNLSDDAFYDRFAQVFVSMQNSMEELVNIGGNQSQQLRDEAKMYKNLLPFMLSTYEADLTGINANPSATGSKAADAFVPLWKRILAQYTGLSTLEMTSTTQTMDRYRNDMAVRNMASNVMSATMKSMGIDTAMRLVSVGGAKQLKEDSAATLQVDWKKTRDNIKAFSLAISASTDVVSAYKKSLEDELETYQQLIIAGYTQGEDQNGGESQFISVKKLAQYAQSNEQLVNAFGDVLETASGNKYKVDDLRFTEEGIFDKFNNKIEDQVKVTSNISRFLEDILPDIYKDIHEATVAELDNDMLNKMFSNIASTSFLNSYLKHPANTDTASFVNTNPEYASSFINSFITSNKIGNDYIEGISNSDILIAAANYSPKKYEETSNKISQMFRDNGLVWTDEMEKMSVENDKQKAAAELLTQAFEELANHLNTFTNTELYKDLFQKNYTKTRDDALNATWLKLIGANSPSQLSPTAWMDEGGYDLFYKFIKDMYGVDSQYTMEDLYNKGLANGGKMKNYNIFSKRFGKEVEWTEGGEEVYLNGNRWFGEGLVEETLNWNKALQDTLETMKSLGEETSNLVGELSKKTLLTPFETGGEFLAKKWVGALQDGEEWTVLTAKAMKDLGAETLKSLGSIMAKAGFELIARGAINDNWAMIAGGFALAATGGFATGIGGALTEGQKDSKSDSEADKLQDLKDQLADLLEQARKDALYYESNLRHKTALGINRGFSMKSVNDAIITPQGDVVTTDPKDYLIATKTPGQFAGNGGVTVSPIINCNVVNNTNAKVTQQQQQNADGSIDIITIIEDTVGQYIASSKSDDAFSSRDYRLRGRQSIMN